MLSLPQLVAQTAHVGLSSSTTCREVTYLISRTHTLAIHTFPQVSLPSTSEPHLLLWTQLIDRARLIQHASLQATYTLPLHIHCDSRTCSIRHMPIRLCCFGHGLLWRCWGHLGRYTGCNRTGYCCRVQYCVRGLFCQMCNRSSGSDSLDACSREYRGWSRKWAVQQAAQVIGVRWF